MARKLKASEAVIAWTAPDEIGRKYYPQTAGKVTAGPCGAWTMDYEMTGGAAWAHVQDLEGADALVHLFGEFGKLTMDYGMDPKAVHRAFMGITEYADAMKAYRLPYHQMGL